MAILMSDKETVVEKETPKKEEHRQSEKKVKPAVIDTPNYDLIEELTPEEREAIKEAEEKPEEESFEAKRKKRIRIRIASIAMAVIGFMSLSWTAYNIASIASVNTQITAVATEYSINIAKYALKIKALDGLNNGNELIETYPEELQDKTEIIPQSNWFDRFCNWLSRIFGGG